MTKSKGLVAIAALIIPASVVAGVIYAFKQQLLFAAPMLFAIGLGVTVITVVYIRQKVG